MRRLCSIPLAGLALVLPAGAAQTFAFPGAEGVPGVDPGPQGTPHGGPFATELAGCRLSAHPWIEHARTFFEGLPVEIAVDPSRLPFVLEGTFDVYVTEHRPPAAWEESPQLVDVAGAPRPATFGSRTIAVNVVTIDTGALRGGSGTAFGAGYDVVIDVDGDGLLSEADVIDGFDVEPGFFVARDPMQPGPLAVTETSYFVQGPKAGFRGENTFYPTDVANLGKLPLVVVSHGNGHNYNWYDHIGTHLASWGFVVMSHQNDTGPGIETASTTTLEHTDAFLGSLDTIDGGVLDGHVDSKRILWIGHSRGGEGITRAYKRIFDGDWQPVNYRRKDIRGLSSIAPTTFMGKNFSSPEDAPFHLWTGGADADVTGCANLNQTHTFKLHERATSDRYSIYLHGVGHGAFHNGFGSLVANGPCIVGRAATHQLMCAQLLALTKVLFEGNAPATDLLWRPYPRLVPPSAIDNPCVVVDTTYQKRSADRFVLDDFATNTTTDTSSAGGRVSWTVDHLSEATQFDPTGNFTHGASEPTNGMTMHGSVNGLVRGGIVGWTERGQWVEWEIPVGRRDVRAFEFFSFRAAQVTRHPETVAELGDATFRVGLRDEAGRWSALDLGALGAGIEEPYARGGCGLGTGWANFFETVRLRLTDFLVDGNFVDLGNVEAVRFAFGAPGDSPIGRLAVDELEFVDE